MATRILECGNVCRREDGLPIVPRILLEQAAMTASGTSAQSAAFSTALGSVCIQSDEAVYVKIGANPTATTDCYRIPAGGEQWFECAKGEKVAIRT